MDFVSIAVKDAAVMAALSDLARRTNDLSIPMQDIGVEFSELIRQTFSDSQSPWGVKWDKLSAVTQAKNKGRRAGGEPLRDTGRLMASIAPKAADGGQAVTIGATKRQVCQYAPVRSEARRVWENKAQRANSVGQCSIPPIHADSG